MDSQLQSKSMEFLQGSVKGAMEDYELRDPQVEMMNAMRQNHRRQRVSPR